MKKVRVTWLCVVLLCCQLPAMTSGSNLTPDEHKRPAVNTYLTFPEWFLVFSPAEYADYVQHNYPSNFPFVGHIHQFWQSYSAVSRATISGHMEFNGGYHVMIMVIGVSTTVEYGIRSAYETIVGRLSELTSSAPTAEDQFGARVAQDYVDFIRVRPWYEFDFCSRLKGLWNDVPVHGDNQIRKWERRYALTTEYLVKAGYGWLIGIGTHASYELPISETAVVVHHGGGNRELKMLPRYEAFTPAAMALAIQGNDFVEIAGNEADKDILISVITDYSWSVPPDAHLLFKQPVITKPGQQRQVVTVPVRSLASLLLTLDQSHIHIEHVFDY